MRGCLSLKLFYHQYREQPQAGGEEVEEGVGVVPRDPLVLASSSSPGDQ